MVRQGRQACRPAPAFRTPIPFKSGHFLNRDLVAGNLPPSGRDTAADRLAAVLTVFDATIHVRGAALLSPLDRGKHQAAC